MLQPHKPLVCTVVGSRGKVGQAVTKMLQTNQNVSKVLHINRGQPWELQDQGPIWVCTTNDALRDVICSAPKQRHADLIFLQNGFLLPLLREFSLENNTQVVLYMAAREDGSYTDGKRTVAWGRWAQHAASVLQDGGVTCKALDTKESLHQAQVEKLLWASLFWMMSAALGGKQVGKIAREDRGLVESLVAELLPVIASQYGNGIKTDVKAITDVLLEYSLSISSAVPSREMACAEFAWRNGAFLQAQGITPLHAAWLEKAGINVDEQIKRMMTST